MPFIVLIPLTILMIWFSWHWSQWQIKAIHECFSKRWFVAGLLSMFMLLGTNLINFSIIIWWFESNPYITPFFPWELIFDSWLFKTR